MVKLSDALHPDVSYSVLKRSVAQFVQEGLRVVDVMQIVSIVTHLESVACAETASPSGSLTPLARAGHVSLSIRDDSELLEQEGKDRPDERGGGGGRREASASDVTTEHVLAGTGDKIRVSRKSLDEHVQYDVWSPEAQRKMASAYMFQKLASSTGVDACMQSSNGGDTRVTCLTLGRPAGFKVPFVWNFEVHGSAMASMLLVQRGAEQPSFRCQVRANHTLYALKQVYKYIVPDVGKISYPCNVSVLRRELDHVLARVSVCIVEGVLKYEHLRAIANMTQGEWNRNVRDSLQNTLYVRGTSGADAPCSAASSCCSSVASDAERDDGDDARTSSAHSTPTRVSILKRSRVSDDAYTHSAGPLSEARRMRVCHAVGPGGALSKDERTGEACLALYGACFGRGDKANEGGALCAGVGAGAGAGAGEGGSKTVRFADNRRSAHMLSPPAARTSFDCASRTLTRRIRHLFGEALGSGLDAFERDDCSQSTERAEADLSFTSTGADMRSLKSPGGASARPSAPTGDTAVWQAQVAHENDEQRMVLSMLKLCLCVYDLALSTCGAENENDNDGSHAHGRKGEDDDVGPAACRSVCLACGSPCEAARAQARAVNAAIARSQTSLRVTYMYRQQECDAVASSSVYARSMHDHWVHGPALCRLCADALGGLAVSNQMLMQVWSRVVAADAGLRIVNKARDCVPPVFGKERFFDCVFRAFMDSEAVRDEDKEALDAECRHVFVSRILGVLNATACTQDVGCVDDDELVWSEWRKKCVYIMGSGIVTLMSKYVLSCAVYHIEQGRLRQTDAPRASVMHSGLSGLGVMPAAHAATQPEHDGMRIVPMAILEMEYVFSRNHELARKANESVARNMMDQYGCTFTQISPRSTASYACVHGIV